jgi:NTP pyrophosphatase (non-canonical NTP hydrolase)
MKMTNTVTIDLKTYNELLANTVMYNTMKEKNNMNELIKQVEKWSKDKDLHKADPTRQALKVWEESGEVGAALSRNKLDDLKDGIGDTVVTLIILAQQHGWSLQECLQYAYDEIKDRRGETRNGTFIKESDLQG